MEQKIKKIENTLKEIERLQKVVADILRDSCYLPDEYAETLLKDVRGELYIQLDSAKKTL